MFRLFAETSAEIYQLAPFFPPEEVIDEPDSIKYAGLSQFDIDFIKKMEAEDAALAASKTPEEKEIEQNKLWGYPMFEACTINESALGILKGDGYFNSGYRKAFFFVWESMKKGMTKEQIFEAWRKKPLQEKK